MKISIRMMNTCRVLQGNFGLGLGEVPREGRLENKSDKRYGGF